MYTHGTRRLHPAVPGTQRLPLSDDTIQVFALGLRRTALELRVSKKLRNADFTRSLYRANAAAVSPGYSASPRSLGIHPQWLSRLVRYRIPQTVYCTVRY